jgi:hypothetical protein
MEKIKRGKKPATSMQLNATLEKKKELEIDIENIIIYRRNK